MTPSIPPLLAIALATTITTAPSTDPIRNAPSQPSTPTSQGMSDGTDSQVPSRWDDAELMQRTQKVFQGLGPCDARETYLLEIARRGVRLAPFVRSLLSEIGAQPRGTVAVDAREYRPLDVVTVLRRIEGKSDPVRVDVEGGEIETRDGVERRVVEVTWPERLWLHVSARNVDDGPIDFVDPMDLEADREALWNVRVTSPSGAIVEGLTTRVPRSRWATAQYPAFPSGPYRWPTDVHLVPEQSFAGELDVKEYVEFLEPGDHKVRAAFHVPLEDELHAHGGHEALEMQTFGMDDVSSNAKRATAARLECVSSPIVVRVRPRIVECTRKELKELRACFERIDTSRPVELSWSTGWIPDDSNDPVQRIVGAGWTSIPVLLDVLTAPDASTERRAWALALLYDITGCCDPERAPDAVGPFRLVTLSGVRPGQSRYDSDVMGPPRANRGAQEPLVARWTAMRPLIDVRIRD